MVYRSAFLFLTGLVAVSGVRAASGQIATPAELGQGTWVPSQGPGPAAQRRDPPPQGQRIQARDGDLVVVENDDRVSIVRRRQANVRIVVQETNQVAVVLADFTFGPQPSDGLVDWSWRFELNNGAGPLESRWEGPATIDEWMPSESMVGRGLALDLPQGRVRFVPGRAAPPELDDAAAVLTYNGGGGGGVGGVPFDEAERLAFSQGVGFRRIERSGVGFAQERVSTGVVGSVSPPGGPSGVVRVGGNIAPPRKIHHVDPVMPETARLARVQGTVILELTIDPQGSVQAARVLRSVPLLDRAALAAARQWQFEPTIFKDQAVPVIMTVPVEFPR
jgi:TonB family protein